MKLSYFKKQSGFTLIELLVVLAIIGILSSVGVPSYNKFIEHGRFSQATNDLYNAYRFARAEAIKTSSPMTLQPKTGGWANGWEVVSSGGGTLLSVRAPHNTVYISGNIITVFGRGSVSLASATTSLTISSAQRTLSICILQSGQSKKGGC